MIDDSPFINKNKRYMTDEERIKHLEHGIRELKKQIHNLKQEKAELKAKLRKWEQGKYRYFGNDGEQDLYEDVDIIRINEKGQVIDDEGNRYSHTTFHHAN